MNESFDGTKLKILQRTRDIFQNQGYNAPTMTSIADACGLTRRALYHHFRNKEEILRSLIVWGNMEARDRADWAAQKALARNDSTLDVIADWLDSRFGYTRRAVVRTPYGEELNQIAFSLCNDVMIEVSYETNARLVALLNELCRRGALSLKPGLSTTELAQVIGDGARGVNQQRPPVPASEVAPRYRRITQAILYGYADSKVKNADTLLQGSERLSN